jgi:PAS domain S-box-containing protein
MNKINQTPSVQDETADLKNRLEETEETLQAIQQNLVDAFIVNRANKVEVVTLTGAEVPYRLMVESMNEGALTLTQDGLIFYCNPRFGIMLQVESEKLIGTQILDLIPPEEHRAFNENLEQAEQHGIRGEFHLKTASGKTIPVQLSMHQLETAEASGISIIATDMSERIKSKEKIQSLAAKLTTVEQRERHRLSQILHDDLQQRLFAIRAQLSIFMDDLQKGHEATHMLVDLEQIQNWLLESITLTRNLSIDISPILLQGDGLAGAMEWLANQMKEQYGLEVTLEVKENFYTLDNSLRILLFQAVRELLFNIIKHAETKQATIVLEQVGEQPCLIIRDDGKGFDTTSVINNPNQSHGLITIQDRLSLIGYTMAVTSQLNQGTQVILEPAE